MLNIYKIIFYILLKIIFKGEKKGQNALLNKKYHWIIVFYPLKSDKMFNCLLKKLLL